MAYMVLFGPKKDRIGNTFLPEMIPLISFYDISPFPGLIRPLQIAIVILGKLEQEFLYMAAVCNMPDASWNVMPIRPR